jgi:fido (protein-threonine AMPylation protein)
MFARENHLRGLGGDAFCDLLTRYYAEINATHLFREGNGRAQRAFLGQLAPDAGYRVAWERLDPQRTIEVSHAGEFQDGGVWGEPVSIAVARVDHGHPVCPVLGFRCRTRSGR